MRTQESPWRSGLRVTQAQETKVCARSGAVDSNRPQIENAVDRVLLAKARKREPAAWAEIYRAYFSVVYRRIKLLTGKMSVAEEITQETFTQAMLNISSFRESARFSTWLFGIAHNLVRNHWRSLKSTQTAHDRLETISQLKGQLSIDQRYLDQRRIEAVYAALETLPDTLRVVFVFRYFEGMSSSEIAKVLNLNVNNVDARASRARRRIKAILGEKGWISANAAPGSK